MSDYMPFQLDRLLDGGDPDEISPSDLARKDPGQRTQFFRRHGQIFLEMMVSRIVDNFQRYLSELLREALKARPAILSTSEKSLSIEEVLKFTTMDDLVNDVIERRVSTLSYQGFSAVQDWCTSRGIPLTVSASESKKVVDYIATRNIIAHNRGRVDNRYVRAVPDTSLKPGDVRSLEPDDLWNCARALTDTVLRTDDATSKKFNLSLTTLAESS